MTANFAYSTVATAPSPPSSGLTLAVQTGDGAKFPATPFQAAIWPAGSQPSTSNAEIATCTGVAADTLTLIRGTEGSPARTVGAGDQVAAILTAAMHDLPQVNGSPTFDETLLPGYSAVMVEEYVMDATHELIFSDPSELAVI